ncbi:DUF2683 family protein [Flavobacterium subsaxonicum]|uniref:Uncharacterized protein n=1 Tax=Flavobacterium subsaxonicum WB 4.1-42 = DSM 21790 TaxID=1121898 RepID=A0A0A2MJG6_9FLAO|nr:DUF2683 family protein [Flavobacterium subsaxonicum]KGO92767.1 hypothetical protein Q766_11670 [Flavobacterium subsaxonicum WB 4.1-42 = DSM 21790]
MDIVLKNVKKKDLQVIKSLAKALGFEISTPEEKPYDPQFVKEILEAAEGVKNGKGKEISMEEFKKMCGI